MDALTATKPLVFVIDIKTIPALHITNQPRQKFKLAPSVRHSVPKHQPTCNRMRKRRTDGSTITNRRDNPTTLSPPAGSDPRLSMTDGICPRLKFLFEITRLFTLKGVPLIGKKNMKSRKNYFIHRPESRHRAIKRGRATDEPTDQPSNRRDNPTTLSPPAGSDPRLSSIRKADSATSVHRR